MYKNADELICDGNKLPIYFETDNPVVLFASYVLHCVKSKYTIGIENEARLFTFEMKLNDIS
jgi:hypothetical protein